MQAAVWRSGLALGIGFMGLVAHTPQRVEACGGFFCQLVPINQAGEQIIFRQEGERVTAVVQIQYVGEADEFSWVVPVPGIPTLSTGSDALFQSLELATRPQFALEVRGDACANFDNLGGGGSIFTGAPEASQDDGDVTILESGVVGPFNTQIVASDDPAALARWLDDNGYDLSDRGAELITPYVEDGMNFVALRLQKDQGVGDIRPLIMEYQTDKPMIPIRLTAVAAQDDMGVLVWILGPGRAIPLNYLHVVPNYTLLNWYQGSTQAYATYQGLITAAMDEAGGQGFATDYAAALGDLMQQLPSDDALKALVAALNDAPTTTAYYDALIFNGGVLAADQLLEILRRQLPLPVGVDEFVYNDPTTLVAAVGTATAEGARAGINAELIDNEVEPLEATLAVLEGAPFITRLYTTLSADEMTLDPVFSFNSGLGEQALERRATLTQSCGLGGVTTWELTLGAGTGRDGEVVLSGRGTPPFVAPAVDQPSVLRAEFFNDTDTTSDVQIDNGAGLGTVQIDNGGAATCGAGLCGAGSSGLLFVGLCGLVWRRTRRRG